MTDSAAVAAACLTYEGLCDALRLWVVLTLRAFRTRVQ
jgi:hypothetical protein